MTIYYTQKSFYDNGLEQKTTAFPPVRNKPSLLLITFVDSLFQVHTISADLRTTGLPLDLYLPTAI